MRFLQDSYCSCTTPSVQNSAYNPNTHSNNFQRPHDSVRCGSGSTYGGVRSAQPRDFPLGRAQHSGLACRLSKSRARAESYILTISVAAHTDTHTNTHTDSITHTHRPTHSHARHRRDEEHDDRLRDCGGALGRAQVSFN